MSPPAAKASSPTPRRMTQRIDGSFATRCMAADRPRHIAAFTALSLAGLFSAMVAMPSAQSSEMFESMVCACKQIKNFHTDVYGIL